MLLVSWNEKDNPDLAASQVRADARHGARLFRRAIAIGYQELAEQADKQAMEEAFGKNWKLATRPHETAILFNTRVFKWHEGVWVFVHKGEEGVTPTRGFSKLLISYKFRPWIKPFWIYNVHTISHPEHASRTHRFREYMSDLRADMTEQQHKDGYDQFVTGDFNASWLNRRDFGVSAKIIAHHRLDYIVYRPGPQGNTVTVGKSHHNPAFYTDHDVLSVNVKIGR